MEIDKVYSHYRTNKSDQVQLYSNRAAPADGPVIGYIAGVEAIDNITNTYKVIVPSMGNVVLDQVPRVQGDALVGANGVGHKPHALKPGQPVLIRYYGRTRTPIIDGSIWLNGDLEAWKEGKLPGIDTTDPSTGNALFPAPTNPVLLALQGEADAKIAPLLLRSQSPLHPAQSPAQVEVPGSWVIEGVNGDRYESVIGAHHRYSSLEISHTTGPRLSLTDLPIQQALSKVERFRYEVQSSKDRFYALLNGKFIPQDLRRTESFVPANTIPSSLQALTAHIFNKLDTLLNSLDQASTVATEQLEFLENGILNKAKALINKWDKLNIDLGLANIALPGLSSGLDLKVDFTTGVPLLDKFLEQQVNQLLSEVAVDSGLSQYLDLLSIIGLASKPTIITGRQPLPLQTEGGLVAGGLHGKTPPFNPEQFSLNNFVGSSDESTNEEGGEGEENFLLNLSQFNNNTNSLTLDPNIPPDLQTGPPAPIDPIPNLDRPTRIKGIVPYKLVSSELNNLNFAEYPEHGLASLLTRYGVENAGAVVRSLLRLEAEKTLPSYLNTLTTIAKLPEQLVLATGLTTLGEEASVATTLIKNVVRLTKPGLNECPGTPEQLDLLITESEQQETITTSSLLRDFFFIEPPDFLSWVNNPSNIISYLESSKSDIAPLADLLLQGKIEDFLVELVYLITGNDLLTLPLQKQSLVDWVRRTFSITPIGA